MIKNQRHGLRKDTFFYIVTHCFFSFFAEILSLCINFGLQRYNKKLRKPKKFSDFFVKKHQTAVVEVFDKVDKK